MEKKNRFRTAFVALSAAALLAACTQPTSPEPPKTVAVSDVYCYLRSAPTDIGWKSGTTSLNLICDIDIYLGGSYAQSDIVAAEFRQGSQSWTWAAPAGDYDPQYKCISGSFYYGNGTTFPLGNFTATVRLSNGATASKNFVICAPGSNQAPTAAFVYTAESTSNVGGIQALGRAVVDSAKKIGYSTEITFTIPTIANVYNGYVCYYSASGAYVGNSRRILDPQTHVPYFGSITSPMTLNVGMNDIISAATGIPMTTTEFAAIASCRVVLLDGAQYSTPGINNWDYKSYSILKPII